MFFHQQALSFYYSLHKIAVVKYEPTAENKALQINVDCGDIPESSPPYISFSSEYESSLILSPTIFFSLIVCLLSQTLFIIRDDT